MCGFCAWSVRSGFVDRALQYCLTLPRSLALAIWRRLLTGRGYHNKCEFLSQSILNRSSSLRLTNGLSGLSKRFTNGSISLGKASYKRLSSRRFTRNIFFSQKLSREFWSRIGRSPLATMMSFDQATARQAELSLSIARSVVNLKKVGSGNFSHAILTTRINSLDKNWNEFTENHRHLCTLRSSENYQHEYFKTNLYNKTEEEYLLAISYHYSCLESFPPPVALPGTAAAAQPIAPTVKQLPRIDLHKFSGNFTDWAEFWDLFISMVTSNNSLTNVERLHYLKTSMMGDASELLKHIATIGENFDRAWTTLTARYENKRLLISSHLKALTSLRAASTESSSELKRLIDGTVGSRGALEQLQRPVKEWDDLLVHLTVLKLDSATRRAWETHWGWNWISDDWPTSGVP